VLNRCHQGLPIQDAHGLRPLPYWVDSCIAISLKFSSGFACSVTVEGDGRDVAIRNFLGEKVRAKSVETCIYRACLRFHSQYGRSAFLLVSLLSEARTSKMKSCSTAMI
jgi:hypothetical protein